MNITSPQIDENVRAEYSALIAYHNSIVTFRFTLLGLYLATIAIVVDKITSPDIAILILVITATLYIAERRNRKLYTKMSKRAMEIEQKHWNMNRINTVDKTVSLFCRFRLDELHENMQKDLPDDLKEELKFDNSIKRQITSHSRGIDLIYLAIFIYALIKALT